MDDATICNHVETLVEYLYGEVESAERAVFEAHLPGCAPCKRELAALRRVRTSLAQWEPPQVRLGFRLTSGDTIRPSVFRRYAPAMGLAAAAVLILAAAAAVANLEVRYGTDGFVVRTGWARGSESVVGNAGFAQRPSAAAVGQTPASTTTAVDWRRELALVEARWRDELASHSRVDAPVSPVAKSGDVSGVNAVNGVNGVVNDARLLARVRALLDESERRQERAQALRFATFARDMQAQRQADFVRVQQGLGHIEGVTNAEIFRQRDWLNHIMRVSQRPDKPQE